MPTILGVPLPSSTTTTTTQTTTPELLLAIVNTLIWLAMTLILYKQILETRHMQARVVRHLKDLEKASQTCTELDRDAEKLHKKLESILEEKEPLRRFAVVPGLTDFRRKLASVGDDLREAMEDELPNSENNAMRAAMEDEFLERVEDGDIEDIYPEVGRDSDEALEILREQARRSAAREEAIERFRRGEPGQWIPGV